MSSTLRLVPGDDWVDIVITITDDNGDPYPLTGKTITGEITFGGNNNTMSVDVTADDLDNGIFSFGKGNADTINLPLGAMSKLKFTAVEGLVTQTLVCINIEGVLCL